MSAAPRSGPQLRIGLGLIAAALAAVAAIALLAPAGGEPAPDPVDPERFFAAETIATAERFRSGQRTLALAALAIQATVLLGLALWRPPWLRRALARLARRPLLGGAAAGAAVVLALALVSSPLALRGHDRAAEVGLSTQDRIEWAGDRAKASGLAGLGGAIGGLALVGLQRRFGRRWWMPGSALVVLYAIAVSWAGPVVITPLFSQVEPLERGPEREQVLELAARAGVGVDEVYVVDASRRSTALNAYVAGIGDTRRVVLYDNLLAAVERPALRSVVAHELAHVANRDIWRGIAFVALVAPFGLLLASLLAAPLATRAGGRSGTPAAVLAYLPAVIVVSFGVGIAGNYLSRQIEERADRDALALTGEPAGLVELQRRLAIRNLSEVDPPAWAQSLFATHPSTLERIGVALAIESRSRGERN